MSRMSPEAEKIMAERFGRDSIIALATSENGAPYVRYVNAYYGNTARPAANASAHHLLASFPSYYPNSP